MACICQRRLFVNLPTRAVTASNRRTITIHHRSNLPDDVADTVPAYPYPTHLYRQGQKGLHGGSRIQFGNTSGEENRPRARRTWSLNVKRKRLYSEALDMRVQLQLTTRVLRTIKKYGGLDAYLLGEKPARIKALGETGWWLRWAIMQTQAIQDRFAEDSGALVARLRQEIHDKASEGLLEAPSSGRETTHEEPEALATTPSDIDPAISDASDEQATRDDGSTVTSDEIAEAVSDVVQTVEAAARDGESVAPGSELAQTISDVVERVVIDNEVADTVKLVEQSPRHRITFRVDKSKQVVLQDNTWVANKHEARRAAHARSIAALAAHQRRLQPQTKDSDAVAAARFIDASITNKRLQQYLPPAFVVFREWLLRNARVVNNKLGIRGKDAQRLSIPVLTQILSYRHQKRIADVQRERAAKRALKR